MEIMLPPLKFLATPLLALVVGKANLVIGFWPPYFRNASAIADCNCIVAAKSKCAFADPVLQYSRTKYILTKAFFYVLKTHGITEKATKHNI